MSNLFGTKLALDGKVLPEQSLWYSVHTDIPVTRRNWFSRHVCGHPESTDFQLTDQRDPSPYQDVFAGRVCTRCGTVTASIQIF